MSVEQDMVRSSFKQALATLEATAGGARWQHADADVLDGQGRSSTNLVPQLATIIGDGPIHDVLDVGTGVGLLAIAVHRTPQDPLAAATQRLRNISDTGASHTVESIIAMCHDAGLGATELNPDAPIPIAVVGGRV